MHFSPSIVTLVFAASTIASDAIPARNQDCVTVETIQAIHSSLEAISTKFDIPFPADFPDLNSINTQDAKSCVPSSVSNATTDVMVKMSLEHDFEKKLFDMQALKVRGTVNSGIQLFKRARSCQEIESSTEQRVASQYSCDSAPHPGACRTCAGFSTGTLASAVAVCGFKDTLAEAAACCVTAALAFATYYSQNCLAK
ncbi:hypothetical protein yc1106_01971 [Curvularia clavata]|uniref:Uncharacterized protein n=1 Tax=Curvularia clavata TaxID=95742 RepID=A0A9Q8Z204_CURCL|nr:hypothetical protein yc1106_01971 [Curvularia clavata]